MSAIYFTPSFNSKPCFITYTLFKNTAGESFDPSCGTGGAYYRYSFLHIGGAFAGQNFCGKQGACTLDEFWLQAGISETSSIDYDYFKVKWTTLSTDKTERQIYMGETKNKFMWLSTSYFSIVDTSNASLLFDTSLKKLSIFSNTTSSDGSISYKDSVELVTTAGSKSGLECNFNGNKTALIQAQSGGGIVRLTSDGAATTTDVWAFDSSAGLSVNSSTTADIIFNTSVLTQYGATSADTMTFRNVGTVARPFLIASTKDQASFGGVVYFDDTKFVPKTFSVCVDGVTKNMKFLAHDPTVDV
jgi:hypothetical protein